MSSKCFSEGSLVKTCVVIAVEEICPQICQDFVNISLLKNTETDLSVNIQHQLKNIANFVPYSVAIDDSSCNRCVVANRCSCNRCADTTQLCHLYKQC